MKRLEKKRLDYLDVRDEKKIELSRLIMAWLSEDISIIVDELMDFDEKRHRKYGDAVDFIGKLRSGKL